LLSGFVSVLLLAMPAAFLLPWARLLA